MNKEGIICSQTNHIWELNFFGNQSSLILQFPLVSSKLASSPTVMISLSLSSLLPENVWTKTNLTNERLRSSHRSEWASLRNFVTAVLVPRGLSATLRAHDETASTTEAASLGHARLLCELEKSAQTRATFYWNIRSFVCWCVQSTKECSQIVRPMDRASHKTRLTHVQLCVIVIDFALSYSA